jgi:hypothetical protein
MSTPSALGSEAPEAHSGAIAGEGRAHVSRGFS